MISFEDQVRAAIADRETTTQLPDGAEIVQRGMRRQRRNRLVVSAVGAVTLFGLVLGLGTALNSTTEDSGEVYSGSEHSALDYSPHAIIERDDELLGLTLVAADQSPYRATVDNADPIPGELTLVSSRDGVEWEAVSSIRVDDLTLWGSGGSALDIHDGVLYVAAVRSDHALAVDGAPRTWWLDLLSFDLASESWRPGTASSVVGQDDGSSTWTNLEMIVTEDGTALQLLSAPNFPTHDVQAAIEPTEQVCDVQPGPGSLQVRPCGSDQTVRVTSEVSINTQAPKVDTYFAPAAPAGTLDFELVSSNEFPAQGMYRTDDGFGISKGVCSTALCAGTNPFGETADAQTWSDPFGPLANAAFVAARGDERLVGDPFRIQGPNGEPVFGLYYRPDADPNSWETINVPIPESGIGTPPDTIVSLSDLVADDEGWLAIYQVSTPVFPGQPATAQPVLFEADGTTFEGLVPFGPATLRGADGEVLLEWDHFETEQLPFQASDDPRVTVAPDGSVVFSFEAGTATFPWELWAEVSSTVELRSAVLHSVDGREWNWLELPAGGLLFGQRPPFLDGDDVVAQFFGAGSLVIRRLPVPTPS